jgi:chromate transport protein ChrA
MRLAALRGAGAPQLAGQGGMRDDMATIQAPASPPRTTGGEALPSFGEFFKVWLKIGCINFGGPAGQIAMMHRMMVDEKKWIDEPRFLHALNFCMLLPGPEAQKLATYIGWLLHGIRGGLVAGILFVLPGAFVMLGLSLLYALGRGFSVVDGALFGIKAAVLVIVLEALIRIGKRALKTSTLLGLAAAAYVGIFFLAMPFPLIVLAAGVVGFLVAQSSPQLLGLKADVGVLTKPAPGRWRQAVTATVIGLVAWWAPVALAVVTLGPNHVLVLGAAMTTWVTFAPAMLLIFAGAPFIEQLRGNRRLSGALAAITAAVVGVILNLSVWFALHVLFGQVQERHLGPLRWYAIDLWALDLRASALAVIAGVLAFGLHRGLVETVAVMAALGIAVRLVSG